MFQTQYLAELFKHFIVNVISRSPAGQLPAEQCFSIFRPQISIIIKRIMASNVRIILVGGYEQKVSVAHE